jgi:hypothetical protein
VTQNQNIFALRRVFKASGSRYKGHFAAEVCCCVVETVRGSCFDIRISEKGSLPLDAQKKR